MDLKLLQLMKVTALLLFPLDTSSRCVKMKDQHLRKRKGLMTVLTNREAQYRAGFVSDTGANASATQTQTLIGQNTATKLCGPHLRTLVGMVPLCETKTFTRNSDDFLAVTRVCNS